jgi:hypothetical protein
MWVRSVTLALSSGSTRTGSVLLRTEEPASRQNADAGRRGRAGRQHPLHQLNSLRAADNCLSVGWRLERAAPAAALAFALLRLLRLLVRARQGRQRVLEGQQGLLPDRLLGPLLQPGRTSLLLAWRAGLQRRQRCAARLCHPQLHTPGLLSTGAGWWPTPAAVASRHRTSQPTPASRSRGSVAVFSARLPFYTSPCSAASRRWRIALAPGFVRPLGCIASLPHARSTGPRGYSLSLSNTPGLTLAGVLSLSLKHTRPRHASEGHSFRTLSSPASALRRRLRWPGSAACTSGPVHPPPSAPVRNCPFPRWLPSAPPAPAPSSAPRLVTTHSNSSRLAMYGPSRDQQRPTATASCAPPR